jgi:hypothetical protein
MNENDQLKNIEDKVDRIEEKINYILSLMEELFADYDKEEDEEEIDEDNVGNEGWIIGLDSWKENYDDED